LSRGSKEKIERIGIHIPTSVIIYNRFIQRKVYASLIVALKDSKTRAHLLLFTLYWCLINYCGVV